MTLQHQTDQQDLLRRIEEFQLDLPGVSFSFSDRLARENGWSRAYTRRVIAEYKRFVFMAMTAGHPVTPPTDVDQAWHLHMTYTRSYWERLCGEVLGAPLHHEPTVGGGAEQRKFTDWYSRTMESYAKIFGTPPPSDIWPAPAIRLAAESTIRQVSARTHWTIRKPRLRPFIPAMLALLGCAFITGCAMSKSSAVTLFAVLGGIAMITTIAIVINQASKRQEGREESGGDGGGGGWVYGGESVLFDNTDHDDTGSGHDGGDGGSDGGSDSTGDGGGDSGCSGCGGCGGS